MRTLAIALTLLAATPLRAETPEYHDTLAEAEREFALGVSKRDLLLQSRKHFSRSADRYLELHHQGVRTPGLYLNLGNAAVLADRWPVALWAYHTGLKLDPNHSQLRDQRARIRAKVNRPLHGVGRNEPEHWPDWLYRPSPGLFAVLGCLAHALAWLIGTLAVLRRSGRLVMVAIFALLTASGCTVGWWLETTSIGVDRATPLLILADNTPLYRGNGINYPSHPDIAMLPRGLEARQLHRRGGWMRIRLTSGEIGWIPASAAFVVAP